MADIVTRAQWGARPARSRRAISLPTPGLWLHHTAAATADGPAGVRQTQNFHMDSRGYQDIAYSFLVDRRGIIYEGRGAGIAGGHTLNHNTTSHGICVLGHYNRETPTAETVDALVRLVRHGRERGWWDLFTGGHRDTRGSRAGDCPGDRLQRLIPDINRRVESPEEDEPMLKRGDKGNAVGVVQQALIAWNPNALPKWGVDKDYGGETEEWVRRYQRAAQIPVTGAVTDPTGWLLARYVPVRMPER